MRRVAAYTDGSANWRNGLGGFGAFIKFDDGSEDALSEGFSQTKTGRMEIMAVLETIRLVPIECHLTVHSDSEYVVKSFNEGRLKRWIFTGFSGGVKNSDLWKQVHRELMKKNINFHIHHVKGHRTLIEADEDGFLSDEDLKTNIDIEGNFYADALADYKQFTDRKKDISDEVWAYERSNK